MFANKPVHYHGHIDGAAVTLLFLFAVNLAFFTVATSCTPPAGGGPEPAGDTTAPTISIVSTTTDPTGNPLVDVKIIFSEVVTGFDMSDLTITNATASNFATADNKTYTVDLTPTPPESTVTLNISAGVCTDAAGNPNAAPASPFSRVCTRRPTVVISSATRAVTNANPIPITITFNMAVENFASTDVTLTNCTIATLATTDNIVWTADLTALGQGTLDATVPAGVCNKAGTPAVTNVASSTFSRTYDNVAPWVALTSAEPNPTNTSIQITITFSEPMNSSTFTVGDITVSGGGSASNLQTSNDTVFTADVTPAVQGSVTISVAAGVCQDRAGNTNTAAPSSVTRTYDSIPPGVSIASTAPDPTNVSPIPITITFSEAVTGFTAGDISVSGGGSTGNLQTSDNIVFTASVTPGGPGLVTIDVPSGGCQDPAGNTNSAASPLARNFNAGNSPGALDTGFGAGVGASGWVYSLAVQSDDKVIIGGGFSSYNGTSRGRMARLNTDGSLDTSFLATGAGADDFVYSVALQSDGKILIGGDFTTYNGTSRVRVARLNANGSLDTGFLTTGAGANGAVRSIAVQSDGMILIGGEFTAYNGTSRGYVARLTADGNLDTSFLPTDAGANAKVFAIAVQSDKKILIGGSFTAYNGTSRGHIARLNDTDGSLDTAFLATGVGSDYDVASIKVQSDDKAILGGAFFTYNGIARLHVTRLKTDGSLDTGFLGTSVGTNALVDSITMQSDGKILIAGSFNICNYVNRGHVGRLNGDGSLDTTFLATGAGASFNVFTIAVQSDGRILIGGNFTTYNGTNQGYIARLWN